MSTVLRSTAGVNIAGKYLFATVITNMQLLTVSQTWTDYGIMLQNIPLLSEC